MQLLKLYYISIVGDAVVPIRFVADAGGAVITSGLSSVYPLRCSRLPRSLRWWLCRILESGALMAGQAPWWAC